MSARPQGAAPATSKRGADKRGQIAVEVLLSLRKGIKVKVKVKVNSYSSARASPCCSGNLTASESPALTALRFHEIQRGGPLIRWSTRMARGFRDIDDRTALGVWTQEKMLPSLRRRSPWCFVVMIPKQNH